MIDRFYFLFFIILFCGKSLISQNFYSVDTIQKIEISFSQPNWDFILDTAKQGSDSYTMAQLVKINGVVFDSVGVKYKGNSSFNINNTKNPIHIELDHFKVQDYLGFKDIKLSNGFHEPSMVREVLSYNMLQNYTEIPRANFAQVYINGVYYGVYTNVEAITNTFLDDRFYSNSNTFVFADLGGCNLRYKGADTSFYYSPYTMKSTFGWTRLRDLTDSLKNNIAGIENILDVDRTLWMFAALNSMVTLDSYIGSSTHNFYIYEDHNGRFNPIMWDLNGAFGTFKKIDNAVPALTKTQLQNLPPLLHINDTMWPLIKGLLSVPMYRKMYLAHMRTMINENFSNNSYYTSAQYYQSVIDTAIQSDTNNFYTHAEFISNLDCTVVDGAAEILGLSELMNARTTFLNSTPGFQAIPPVISNILCSDTFPIINSSIYITVQCTNSSAVYLGYRKSVMDPFKRIMMFDDGLNGDGAAGDGVFGVQVLVNSTQIQYYIYAENNNAGIFSPARAEHEYYTLNSDYATVTPGQVVINEFMAMNSGANINANLQFTDWIELFNNDTVAVSLDHLNLSDDPTNLAKWTFPAGTIIPPNQFLMIWADEDTSSVELHCNFKLSGSGEKIFLSYPNGDIIDSVTYPAQSYNISYGRYPNGTGTFQVMYETFNNYNSLVGISETQVNALVSVFPNPSTGEINFFLKNHTEGEYKVQFYDLSGKSVHSQSISSTTTKINLQVASGMYFFNVQCKGEVIGNGKISIQK